MLRRSFPLFGALAFLAFAAGTASAVDYRPYLITNLGTLGNTAGYTKAWGINESGQVCGESRRSTGGSQAYYWSNSTMQDIGDTFGGTTTASWAIDINDSGRVMGYAIQDGVRKLWTWKNGEGYTLAGTATVITPTAMNNNGIIVGRATCPTGSTNTSYQQAFYYNGAGIVDIGAAAGFQEGYSNAVDVNDSGKVLCSGYDNYEKIPYTYDTTAGTYSSLKNAIAGGTMTDAFAINNNGWMVLQGTVGTQLGIYMWDGTNTTLVSTPGSGGTASVSSAYAINNQGQVVGGSYLFDSTSGESTSLRDLVSDQDWYDSPQYIYDPITGEITVIYDTEGEWTNLDVAYSINETGQIVGYGKSKNYTQYVGFLMTPTLFGDANIDGSVNGTDLNTVLSNYNATFTGDNQTLWLAGDFNCDGSVNGTDLNTVLSNYNQSVSSSTAAVPEPSTLLLMVLGIAGLLAWRKRK